jgi:hypothetical protein
MPLTPYDSASIFAQIALVSALLIFAASRFFAVRSNLCARKQRFTFVFAELQIPSALIMKPRAWHSSSIAMTSSQAADASGLSVERERK